MNTNLHKAKKFVASFSGGKDSTLALYKAIRSGMIPLGLIMTYNIDRKISWFHGIKPEIIKKLEKSLEFPITLIRTDGQNYEMNFEKELLNQKAAGAEVCVFGDIDLADHLDWCTTRCRNCGIEPSFPLWQNNRKDVVMEFINSGFITRITVIDTERMAPSYLGKVLTRDLIAAMEADGIDVCGENGEFHTSVTDGPLFQTPLDVKFSEPIRRGKYLTLEMY